MKKNNEDILAKAIEKLKNQQIPPDPPQELVEATLRRIKDETDKSEGQNSKHISLVEIITNRRNTLMLTTKIAAAAVLLILAGYFMGQLTAPQPSDVQQLQAALEPAIRQNLLQEMARYWQVGLASGFTQLKDELQQQYRQDLSNFAIQTLAATNAVTNQRLENLIDAINTAQTEDRRSVAAALKQIELNRIRDNAQLGNALVSVAVHTEDELLRTKQDLAHLMTYTQPDSLVPSEFNNLSDDSQGSNNINERGKK